MSLLFYPPVMAKPAVMFVCPDNAASSQLAGALLRQAMGDAVEVQTSGLTPAGELDPATVAALDEAGVPVDGEHPKPVDALVLRRMDLTVLLGEDTRLAPVTGMSGPMETWLLEQTPGSDPAGQQRLRDELKARVDDLAADLRGILGLPEGREPGAELDPVTGAPVCRD